MTVQVQAFPVRFAETVNRLGAARAERLETEAAEPALALATLGSRTVVARPTGSVSAGAAARPWCRCADG